MSASPGWLIAKATTRGSCRPRWRNGRSGQELNVRVDGRLSFNGSQPILRAALAGFGLAFVLEDYVHDHMTQGRLIHVLDDWCPPFPGYHLYYPSRRQHSPAFALPVEALRYRPRLTGDVDLKVACS